VVINDILDFSRIEAGRLNLESADFLHPPMHRRRRCGRLRPLAAGKGLRMLTEVAGDVPDWVRGDSHRLRQILLNLTGNAVKFTETGHISVRVSLEEAELSPAGDPSRTSIRFAVSDTGMGIPEAQQPLIFQPFQQADGSITRRYRTGSGLGLSIRQPAGRAE